MIEKLRRWLALQAEKVTLKKLEAFFDKHKYSRSMSPEDFKTLKNLEEAVQLYSWSLRDQLRRLKIGTPAFNERREVLSRFDAAADKLNCIQLNLYR